MSKSAYKVGKKYFIRTATYHIVGELKGNFKKELVLENASWIADSGRFNNALKTGIFEEVEPFVEDVIVQKTGIIDATIFNHPLPMEVR